MRTLPSAGPAGRRVGAAIDASLAYLALGALAGLLAGLLGVGGGVVIVPALNAIFLGLGFAPAQSFHLALGSSLATIVFTGLSSAAAHRRRGAVRGIWLRRLGPWTAFGTFAGGLGAASAPRPWLQAFFALFLVFVAWRLWAAPGPGRGDAARSESGSGSGPGAEPLAPGRLETGLAGSSIGLVSSLVGIGGGTLTVPYLVWRREGLRAAVGTSSALGVVIALAGALGYALGGQGAPTPAGSLGFVYLPAVAGVGLASALTAPLGARLAHALPAARLRRGFALFLLVMAIHLAVSLYRLV